MRAAALVAAGCAALLARANAASVGGRFVIAVDGSVHEKYAKFQQRLQVCLIVALLLLPRAYHHSFVKSLKTARDTTACISAGAGALSGCSLLSVTPAKSRCTTMKGRSRQAAAQAALHRDVARIGGAVVASQARDTAAVNPGAAAASSAAAAALQDHGRGFTVEFTHVNDGSGLGAAVIAAAEHAARVHGGEPKA